MKYATLLTLILSLSTGCEDSKIDNDPVRNNAPVACEASQPCPVGSMCNGTFCVAIPVDAPAPMSCEAPEDCADGFTCDEGTCIYQTGTECSQDSDPGHCGAGFCRYELELACGDTGEFGVCSERLESIRVEEAIVCGCDGNSYWNADWAHAMGISVQYSGLCEDPEAP